MNPPPGRAGSALRKLANFPEVFTNFISSNYFNNDILII